MRFLFTSLLLFFTHSVFSQVSDNFNDGDFSSNPKWLGDTTEFIVNSSQQLQLNNTIAGASYLVTSTNLSSLNNIQWDFYVKQNFASSGNNYGRVYLVSDQVNLKDLLNGYYLQFGETGNNDAIELFKQKGNTSLSICRGVNSSIANSFALSVKVTRDAKGLWTLYTDLNGGTNYNEEASGTDSSFITPLYFGVSATYTASNAAKFYYDDFYMGPIIRDTLPPSIIKTTVVSSTQLDVLFNEALDLMSSQNTLNYSVNNSINSPLLAVRDSVNFNLVHLFFTTAFQSGLQNTLSINAIQDNNGNAMNGSNLTFTYYQLSKGSYKEVIITELMTDPNPPVGLPNSEYIELYNNSANYINLKAWKITDNLTTNATINSDYILAPNAYVLITAMADTNLFHDVTNKIGINNFPTLNDAGDHIYLQNNNNILIDSINYNSGWYKDATKSNGGWALELINPSANVNCPGINNWTASTYVSGGTPGKKNSVYSVFVDSIAPQIINLNVIDSTHIRICFSEYIDTTILLNSSNYSINNGLGIFKNISSNNFCVDLTLSSALHNQTNYTLTIFSLNDCSGNKMNTSTISFSYYRPKVNDVVINEIMCDPDPVVSLPNYEYIELYNKSKYQINLNRWSLSTPSSIKYISNVVIFPDSFIVLTGTSGYAAYKGSGLPVYEVVGFPALINAGCTLVLRNEKGELMNAVAYSDQWYGDLTKSEGGFSLEMMDPFNPCGEAENWGASKNKNGGTPGKINSIRALNPDHSNPSLERISVLSSDSIQLYFSETMDSLTLLNPMNYTIDQGIGQPIKLIPMAPQFKSVKLKLANTLNDKTIYTCTVTNNYDCAGNSIETNNTARFAVPQAVSANDIVINEIMFDPASGGTEWIELYNRSNKTIDLTSLLVGKYDTVQNKPINTETISTSGYLLFPEEYLVLSENSSLIKSQYSTSFPQGFIKLSALPALYKEDVISISDQNKNVIDYVKYNEKMHFPLLNITKGVSLERIDFNRSGNDKTNWNSASSQVGFASPAYRNSQYMQNEGGAHVHVSPEIFSPDNDGYNDVLNIHYQFNESGKVANIMIYDGQGRFVKYLVKNEHLGSEGAFSWNGITDTNEKAPMGIYVIYVEAFNVRGDVIKYKLSAVLANKL